MRSSAVRNPQKYTQETATAPQAHVTAEESQLPGQDCVFKGEGALKEDAIVNILDRQDMVCERSNAGYLVSRPLFRQGCT